MLSYQQVITTSLQRNVVEEVWLGYPINLDNLKKNCCPTYVHIPSEGRSKLYLELKKYVFFSRAKGVKGFKLWDLVL